MAVVALLAFVVAPPSARAWTDAHVRRVSAHLDVAADARTIVTISCELRIESGWLELLELDGLEPDLALLPDRPPRFEDASGVVYAPSVELRGEGRIVLTFRRRSAPRRGDYVATVVYQGRATTEPLDDGTLRLTWTLPGWKNDLEGAAILVDAPLGTVLEHDEVDPGSVRILRIDRGERERFELFRPHLPRTREWQIVLRVPAERMDPSLRTAAPVSAAPSAAHPRPQHAPDPGPAPFGAFAIALFLAAYALGRIATMARVEQETRLEPTALLPLGASLRAVLVLALGLGAGMAGSLGHHELYFAGLVGITLLALHRRADAPRPPRLGSFRPVRSIDLVAARRALRRHRFAPFDAGTVPGAALVAAMAAAPILVWAGGDLPIPVAHAVLAASLGGAISIAGHRGTRPTAPLVDLAYLLALAARIRANLDDDRRWALRPVLHVDVRGQVQEARLRVVLPNIPKGLLRLDVVRAFRAERTRWVAVPALLVVARENSPADRALEQRFPGTPIASAPRRIARTFPIEGSDLARALAPVLEALAACPVEPDARAELQEPTPLAATG